MRGCDHLTMKFLPPLIIIGMHRSGTSLVSRVLEDIGVFMGHRKDENNEAIFFQRLNEWMFRQVNASWDNPYNFLFVNDFLKKNFLRVIDSHLKGVRRIEYLGTSRFLRYTDIRKIDFLWGWKDPKNTFTLDIWKEVFPSLRILHIYRNPVDVALSLKRREDEFQKGFRLNPVRRLKERLLRGRPGYALSVRILDICEGIKLWHEYLDKGFSLDDKNIMHIKYETFLDDPETVLKDIFNFAGIDIDKSRILRITDSIKRDRKFIFLKDDSLVKLYEEIRNTELMKKLGYHEILP